jgi:hypothetical protein
MAMSAAGLSSVFVLEYLRMPENRKQHDLFLLFHSLYSCVSNAHDPV